VLRPVDDSVIRNIWLSAAHLPALSIADALGLFAALDGSPATSDELAERIAVSPRAADILANLMTSLGLLLQADARFHLTEVARECLLPSSTYYWGPFLERTRNMPLDANRLLAELRSGGGSGRVEPVWNSAAPDAGKLRAFTAAMHCQSLPLAARSVPHLGLTDARHMLDVAGGSGSFCVAALLRHADLRCTLLDLPPVCDVAREHATGYGVQDRLQLVPGDMFTGNWPGGADVAFFNDIFHDWDDERCIALAKHAHAALAVGGTVIVHEMLLWDQRHGPLPAATYSLVMLFATSGRQRTAGELSSILMRAGFVGITFAPTVGGYVAVRGQKV
jgi:acetylserotonin N-methyltransferase